MMWTTVAIPTLGESELLGPLVRDLIDQGGYDSLIVMDNRPPGEANIALVPDPCLNNGLAFEMRYPEMSLHQMWNWAWRQCMSKSCTANLVLLNDDIRIPPEFVTRLVAALRSNDDVWCAYPNYRRVLADDDPADTTLTPTRDTYRRGGLWGCAFALRAELLNNPLPPIDDQFVIWCGDDDLVKQIDLAGKRVCRVNGLALEHEMSTTVMRRPHLYEIGWQDIERFKAKYGSW
jgi:GT2 family glycosyltransferase